MKSKKIVLGAITAALLTLSAAAAFDKVNTYADGQFSDVKASEWYAKEVKSTYELGLMNGTGGGLFAPDGNVTVAEAITMAARAAASYAGETIEAADGECGSDRLRGHGRTGPPAGASALCGGSRRRPVQGPDSARRCR